MHKLQMSKIWHHKLYTLIVIKVNMLKKTINMVKLIS